MPVMPPKPVEPKRADDYLEVPQTPENRLREFRPNVPVVGVEQTPENMQVTPQATAGKIQNISHQTEQPQEDEQPQEPSSVESFLTGQFNGFVMPTYVNYDWRELEARANARASGHNIGPLREPGHSNLEGLGRTALGLVDLARSATPQHLASQAVMAVAGSKAFQTQTNAARALLDQAYRGFTLVHDVMTEKTPMRVPDEIGGGEVINPEVINRSMDLVTILPLMSGALTSAQGVVTGVAANSRIAALPLLAMMRGKRPLFEPPTSAAEAIAPPFYSQLEKAIGDAPFESATAIDWQKYITPEPAYNKEVMKRDQTLVPNKKGEMVPSNKPIPLLDAEGNPMLTGRTNPHTGKPEVAYEHENVKVPARHLPGIKPEEVEWSGIDKLEGEKLTKKQVIGHIKENEKRAQVREVLHGQPPGVPKTASRPKKDTSPATEEEIAMVFDRAEIDWKNLENEYAVAIGERHPVDPVNYKQPIAASTIDRILARPGTISDEMRKAAAAEVAVAIRNAEPRVQAIEVKETHFDKWQTAGPKKNYRELALMLPRKGRVEAPKQDGEYIVPHAHSFGGNESDVNRMAHVRFNDRKTSNGNSLHIEEIQSDMHQAGRDRGYNKAAPFTEKQRERLHFLREEAGRIERRYMGAVERTPEIAERYRIVQEELQPLEEARARAAANTGIPDAPFKGNAWIELSLKRMIRWAAEHGYDSISWTTGKTQADRYNLSRHVKYISAMKEKDGRYLVYIEGRGGGPAIRDRDGWSDQGQKSHTPAELAELIGKEPANRLIEGADRRPTNAWFDIQGEGLDVGGQGMKNFYDTLMVNMANKLGEKYGAKVGVGNLGEIGYRVAKFGSKGSWRILRPDGKPANRINYPSREAAEADLAKTDLAKGNKTIAIWEMPITPALKKKAMSEGFSLFANKSKIAAALSAGIASSRKRAAAIASPDASAGLRHSLEKRGIKTVFPEYRDQYPPTGSPQLMEKSRLKQPGEDESWGYEGEAKPYPGREKLTKAQQDKLIADGKAYLGKGELPPETEAFKKARDQIRKDIKKGNYTPYFDVEKRKDVPSSKFPKYQDTTSQRMKQADTQKKYDAWANEPEAKKLLNEAFKRGLLSKDRSGNWYMVGQLFAEFVKVYGKNAAKEFSRRFSDAMAATTGGANPEQNFLMAMYGNFKRGRGEAFPESHSLPYPIGGRSPAANLEQYDKMVRSGAGVTPQNPKRYNFKKAFEGFIKAWTQDEQMGKAFAKKPGEKKRGMTMPPTGSYGHFQRVGTELARKAGVASRYFQEVAWAGIKQLKDKAFKGKPMIEIINEAIERTSRLTGVSPEEVVREGIVKGLRPIYSNPKEAALAAAVMALNKDPAYKNFKHWFEDSKVADEHGFPKVVYHGSPKAGQIESFETYNTRHGLYGQGAYFTENPEVASEYAVKSGPAKPGHGVVPAYLKIENPLDMDAPADLQLWAEQFSEFVTFEGMEADKVKTNAQAYRYVEGELANENFMLPEAEGGEIMQDGLRSMGYDGITHIGGGKRDRSDTRRHRVWIVFDPEQIKSPYNKGTFDPSDPNIVSANPKAAGVVTGVSSAVSAAGGNKKQEKK